jgi:hypothetical protein
MAMKTRSQTKTPAQRTFAATQDIEQVFRNIHQGAFVLVNPSDLTEDHRIMWWITGIEEGSIADEDIPEKDYRAVYKAIHGK